MQRIRKLIRVVSLEGLNGLIRMLSWNLPYYKNPNQGWKQYPLAFTPLRAKDIASFLKKNSFAASDLAVVPSRFVARLKAVFDGTVISTLEASEYNARRHSRLLWASERVDLGALLARNFYGENKSVIAMGNIGPAKSWHHDNRKEGVMTAELKRQQVEGINKFDHGIGADFGNLLMFIDNTRHLDGDFVEIGCYFGSSTCVMAAYMELIQCQKNFFIYDVFEGFNYPEALTSPDGGWGHSHKTDGRKNVERRVHSRAPSIGQNIHVIQRNVLDDNPLRETGEIAFASIDVDLYEAVSAALFQVHEKLVKNGIAVVEDAGHTPKLLGAKVAVEEFLGQVGLEAYTVLHMESGQYVLIRKE